MPNYTDKSLESRVISANVGWQLMENFFDLHAKFCV